MIYKIKLFITSSRFKIALWYSVIFFLLEIVLGIIIYFYVLNKTESYLDANLETQAKAIIRSLEEKHFDLETFQPDSIYKSKDELIWDILYDAIVFNKRNTFILVSSQKGIIFKTANLRDITLIPEKQKAGKYIFYYRNESLSEHPIRVCRITDSGYDVMVAFPADQTDQLLSLLKELYLLIAPIFLIVSIFWGFVLSSKSLSRIDKIIAKTGEITTKNLNEIIPGGEFKDEFGRLVNQLNDMITRIRKNVEYMNEFSLVVAHELKTPLTILRGELEVALKSDKTKEDYLDVLKSNYEETLRMIRIIDNLFFISKNENQLISMEPHPTELYSFLTKIVENMRLIGNDKNKEIIIQCPQEINIMLDPGLIRQALFNIIDNAFKYGDENTAIEIKVEETKNEIKIDIINRGIGIPADKVEKIFDKFYRVESELTGKAGGVGLGLSVVKSIIEMHKGKIFVSSTPNDITVVTLFLRKGFDESVIL